MTFQIILWCMSVGMIFFFAHIAGWKNQKSQNKSFSLWTQNPRKFEKKKAKEGQNQQVYCMSHIGKIILVYICIHISDMQNDLKIYKYVV